MYKFFRFNENFWSSLKEKYLWFSDVNGYNDPFEFKMALPESFSKDDIQDYYQLMKALDGTKIDTILDGDMTLLYELVQSNPIKFGDLYLQPFLKQIQSLGICCFSNRIDNILMWSHYSESHKGLAIEFDKHQLDQNILDSNSITMTALEEVRYNSNFPIVKLNKNPYKTSEQIRNVVFQKSEDWSYENEIRILSERSGRHNFDSKCIKSIYLGARVEEKQKVELIEELLENEMNHILLYQMELNKRKYQLNSVPIQYHK